MNTSPDARQYAPATQRNRKPILEVLLRVLPNQGDVLEISSGTGEHAAFFAPYFSPRVWIPSDPNPLLRDSINAWRDYYLIENMTRALDLDVHYDTWNVEPQNIKSIVNINMIHIAPWSACLALFRGASKILNQDGILYLYGPYKQGGQHTAPSNQAFDESLRLQNSQWGVRNLEDVVNVSQQEGFKLLEVISMPANNLSVIFKKV